MKKYILLFAVIAIAAIIAAAYFLTRPSVPTAGYGGIREPSIPVPDSLSITRYYDAELDVVCWIFTKKFVGAPYYDTTSDCLPRGQTDY